MAVITKRRKSRGGIAYRVQIRRSGVPSISKTFSSEKNAKAYVRRLEGDVEAGRASPRLRSGRYRLSDVLDRYQQYLNSPQCSLRGTHGRGTHLRWWHKQIGNVRLSDLDGAMIADCVYRLEQEPAPTKSGCRSGSTVNRYVETLSAALKMAIRKWHWLDQNPVKTVERCSEGRRRDRVLSDVEWQRLINACKKHRNRFLEHFVTMAMYTGARRSELRYLKWADVNLERGTAVARQTKSGEDRVLVLVGPAAASLDALAGMRDESSPFVFPGTQLGRPMAFDKPFAEVRATAGLDDGQFVFHSLRHTCLTRLGESGASAFEVKAVSGHKTLSQADRYTHLAAEHARKALERWQLGSEADVDKA